MTHFKPGDKVESLREFLKPWADHDSAFIEDHPEWVDIREGRRGTVVEVSSGPPWELRIRWSHRRDVQGWYRPDWVKAVQP